MHTVGLPRTCLGFTNLVFFMMGTVGFVVCIWCVVNTEFFRDVNYTITKSSLVDTTAKLVNMKLWLTPLTTILIPIALLAMLTSCCGVLGAGCRIKCALKSYIFLVSALSFTAFWLFFVTGIYNIYTDNESTRKSLQQSLKQYYGKENDLITFVWNHVMITHECCGVVSFVDFTDSQWKIDNPSKLYPVQCCKLANLTHLIPVSQGCTLSLDPEIQSYKERGCYYALQLAIKRNKGKIIFYIVFIAFLYSVLTLFAYCIVRGQPLLGAMAGRFTDLLPAKVRDEANNNMVATSNVSLGNMMYVDDTPKRVVKLVSSSNPFQSYKYTPNAYDRESIRSHTLRY